MKILEKRTKMIVGEEPFPATVTWTYLFGIRLWKFIYWTSIMASLIVLGIVSRAI